MRTPHFWILTLALLALAATAGAEDLARNGEARPADRPDTETAAPSSLDEAEPLPALGRLTLPEELNLAAPMTPATEAPSDGFGGGCYIGCLNSVSSQNICGPGKVAEVLVTGPINSCGLADITCKSACFGPIVRCSQFAFCSGGNVR